MATFTYIGDADEVEFFGLLFVNGEATEVPEDHPAMAKLPTNGQFVADDGDGLETFSLAELKAHAAANGIDLGDARKKAEIVAAIRAAA